MSHFTKKLLAILLAFWLPLFSGSALATAVTMQLPADHGQDAAMQMADMGDCGMDKQQSDTGDQADPACHACSVCQLAGTAYLAVSDLDMMTMSPTARIPVPDAVTFHSFIFIPLLPPPLALL